MTEFTMRELLERNGMGERILDSNLTRKIAAKLRERGFHVMRTRNQNVWTDAPVQDCDELATTIVDNIK